MGIFAILIIWTLFFWLEKEKKLNLLLAHDYSILVRLCSGFIVLIGVICITQIQEYRKIDYHFFLGVAPNFLSALILPFGLIVLGKKVNTFQDKPILVWTFYNFGYWVLYEGCLWVDGRNFDFLDMVATFIGAVISGGIAVKLTNSTSKSP